MQAQGEPANSKMKGSSKSVLAKWLSLAPLCRPWIKTKKTTYTIKKVINSDSCTYLFLSPCEMNVIFHNPVENIVLFVRAGTKINCNVIYAYAYYIVKLRGKYISSCVRGERWVQRIKIQIYFHFYMTIFCQVISKTTNHWNGKMHNSR